ncbi:hypothetical protein KXR87_13515 [Yokenella regensburgei]|uniref:hypothetical protein n=1 Tax=Yokenella regensburgei TaxID=158877 RepID=UPI003F16DB3A
MSEENNVSASVPGSLNGVLILPGNPQGGVAGMSEKCDLCHLKLAAFLNIYQAVASGRPLTDPATFEKVIKHKGKACQKNEMLFHDKLIVIMNCVEKIINFRKS